MADWGLFRIGPTSAKAPGKTSRKQVVEEYEEETNEGYDFDIVTIIEDVLEADGVSVIGTLWGYDVAEKENAARKFFGIPRDDEVFLILDTTLFGSCKVGLALCSSGIYMKDEEGAVRAIDWEEFFDQTDVEFEDGTTAAPCGACREFMAQLMPGRYHDVEVMVDYERGRVATLGELTPEWWL